VERFARNEILGDLPFVGDPPFELDAIGTVFGHGFPSPAVSVNPNPEPVHRHGHSKPVVNSSAD
jgi:hypothetical protein